MSGESERLLLELLQELDKSVALILVTSEGLRLGARLVPFDLSSVTLQEISNIVRALCDTMSVIGAVENNPGHITTN